MEVTLAQMLEARESRAFRQMKLARRFALPQISFSMNIPGPAKDTPLIRRGFWAGCQALDAALPENAVRYREIFPAETGWEAAWVLDLPALEVKRIAVQIEDSHGLGRLFDMDVLTSELEKLDRELVQGADRNCIVCGAPGRGCASRRIHSVPQLQAAVRQILIRHFRSWDASQIGDCAVKSLLEEVMTTPKPGLVDQNNTGSHRDMDLPLFSTSARALAPYFLQCARIGQDTADLPPAETFDQLRQVGLSAEKTMFAATNGVNTHKGAIFLLGTLCGAAGRLWSPEGAWDAQAMFAEVAAMTRQAMAADLANMQPETAGQRAYLQYGIGGIRAEIREGLPSVARVGLPVFQTLADQDRNYAGAVTLLHLIPIVQDTTLIHRGGLAGLHNAQEMTSWLLAAHPHPSISDIEALDRWFMDRNLSPGGCADLLASVYFIDLLTK